MFMMNTRRGETKVETKSGLTFILMNKGRQHRLERVYPPQWPWQLSLSSSLAPGSAHSVSCLLTVVMGLAEEQGPEDGIEVMQLISVLKN